MEKNDEIHPERVMESSLELNNGTALWLPFTQLSESGYQAMKQNNEATPSDKRSAL